MRPHDPYMDRKCKHCGLTYGSHHGGNQPVPNNYCPGHEGQMDWENGPGTIFKDSAELTRPVCGTPAKGVKHVRNTDTNRTTA